MKRVRVLHLIKGLGRGGAEVLLRQQLRVADRSSFDFRYAYLAPAKSALVEELRDLGAAVECLDAGHVTLWPRALGRLSASIRRCRPDVMHCHLPITGVMGRIVGRVHSVPTLYTEHNNWSRYHPVTRAVNRLTWGLQTGVIAVSADVAAGISRHGRSGPPVALVRNGIDLTDLYADPDGRERIRRQAGIPADAPVVGTVAVFRAQKQLDIWIKAAALIHRVNPDARFLLVGDGPLRSEVERWISECELRDVVYCAGLQTEVRSWLAAMDVFLMSSKVEGLPLALLEAMAMRLPVAATKVGGIPEVIEDGRSGRLSPPGEPEALSACVIDLLTARDTAAEMGARARRVVEEQFSMQRMARDLEGLYRLAIKGGH